MANSDKIYIEHMLLAAEKIARYIKAVKYKEFIENTEKHDAVIRQIEIIGEAAKHVSTEFKKKVDLPWKDIVGMRDIAIHEYYDLDMTIIWQTVKQNIPTLHSKLAGSIKRR